MDRFTAARPAADAPPLPRPRSAAKADATAAGPGSPPPTPTPPPAPTADRWFAVAAVAAAAVAVFAVSVIAYTQFPLAMKVRPTPQALAPHGLRFLQAFSWWDGAWYVGIAERGYGFMAGRQSPVAFFPAYPLLIRALRPLVGSSVAAGFLISLACGLAASLLFHRWVAERVERPAARLALVALLVYPCSFYLFGVLYADSLFLLLAVSAFVSLERDRTVLAGLAAAVATATRPTGFALALGLWARALERRTALRSLERRDAGLLLAPLGLVAWGGYLWAKFGNPLQFLEAEKGWGQSPGWQTWLKVPWLRELQRQPYLNPPHYHLVGNFLAAVVAIALAVVVFRRLGWGYGIYSLAMVAGSALSTKNFIGTGRYAIAAFPCFAVAGSLLSERKPAVRAVVLGTSAALLVLLAELHARNMLIS